MIFPPLFGHQYSHCWIDFRNTQDAYMRGRGIDYFENSRRATLAQRAYCIANPSGWLAYSDSLWGITASDDPDGYAAHGAPPPVSENGTLTPTASISSLPFASDEVLPVVRTLWNHWRPTLWGPYGWKDAFNPTRNWTGTDVLGIDQGPMVLMIENQQTGAVWRRCMRNPYIQAGLERAGFESSALAVPPSPGSPAGLALWASSGPGARVPRLHFRLPRAAHARLRIFDVQGRHVATLADGWSPAGEQDVNWDDAGRAAGVYLARLEAGGVSVQRRVVMLR